MITHSISLFVCFTVCIFATIGIFNMSGMVIENMDEHWKEISNILISEGYSVRKSYMINQLIIQIKLTGFYLIAYIVFSGISFYCSIYLYLHMEEMMKNNTFLNILSRDPSGASVSKK